MRYTAILVLILLALLQVSLIPPLPLLNVPPNLVLLFVLAWAMLRGLDQAALLAFAGGIVLDLLSSLPLGSHATILLLTVIPIGLLGTSFYSENLAVPTLAAFVATFLYYLFMLLLLGILGHPLLWGHTLWRIVLPQALVQAVLMPLAYWILSRLKQQVQPRMVIG